MPTATVTQTTISSGTSESGFDQKFSTKSRIEFETERQESSKQVWPPFSKLQKRPSLPPVRPRAFWATSRTTSAIARVTIAK